MKQLLCKPVTRIIFLTGLILIMSLGLKPVATFAAAPVTAECYRGGPSDPSPNNIANGQCSCPATGCGGAPVTSECYNGLATNPDLNNSANGQCRCPASGCEGTSSGFNSSGTTFVDRRAAGNVDPASTCTIESADCNINQYIELFINILSGLVGVVVVMVIVIGGIQYGTAGDDPGKLQAAKQRITKALIALLVFIFLYAFLQYLVPGGVI